MVKCVKCTTKLNRAYIRLNFDGKIKRKWITTGYYCQKCEKHYTDKEIIKIKNNKQK